jgi:hypothetical protein
MSIERQLDAILKRTINAGASRLSRVDSQKDAVTAKSASGDLLMNDVTPTRKDQR